MDGMNLADMRALVGPDGSLLPNVVDTMVTSGEFTEDGIWIPSNAFGKHTNVEVTEYASSEARIANRGVPISKGAMGQMEDYIGFFESVSVVDNHVLRSIPEGRKQEARMKYDILHGKKLAQDHRLYSIYGDRSIDINQPNGLITRRGSLGEYCLDAGGSGTRNTSLLLVGWDILDGVHQIHPEDVPGGIISEEFGRQVFIDPNNVDQPRLIPFWVTWFYLDFGVVVLNDRSLIRICNIDPDSTSDAHYQTVYRLINQGMRQLNVEKTKCRFYGNTLGLAFMDNMAIHIENMNIRPMEVEGKTFQESHNGIPLRLLEEISSSEPTVV